MKFITRYKTTILLLIVTLLGGVLRFWNLGNMPPSLNWDEASHGYNAYSILKTGMDEWGFRFPLIFRGFGDYKLPVYIYASILPIWIFGLNAFAVRFISALAGTLAIPGIYLLTKQLFNRHRESRPVQIETSGSAEAISASGIASSSTPRNDGLALIAAFLLAVSPWHFFISRPALEANLSLTIVIFGFYFLLSSLRRQGSINSSSLFLSAIFLGLSLHTYNTARVFVPLLLIATIYIYRSNIKSVIASLVLKPWQSSIALAILISSFSLVAFQIFSGEATARYNKLQILSENTVFQIGEARTASNLPFILPKLLHNRPVYFAKTFVRNFVNYFSPQFFFQSNGSQSQFAIPKTSLLTIPILLLTLIGLFVSLRNINQINYQFLLSWLFLSPVAAALTIDPPQALRPNPMIPALIILAVIALTKLPKLFQYLSLVLIVIYFSLYLQNYFGEYKTKYSQSWQYGYPQIMDFARFYKNDFTNVFITKRLGEPHIFYAFYSHLDPKSIQPGPNNIRFQKSDWFWTDKIENIYFINDWQIPTTSVSNLKLESGMVIPTKNSLLITSPDHVPVNAHIIESVNFLDGTPAFIITSIP